LLRIDARASPWYPMSGPHMAAPVVSPTSLYAWPGIPACWNAFASSPCRLGTHAVSDTRGHPRYWPPPDNACGPDFLWHMYDACVSDRPLYAARFRKVQYRDLRIASCWPAAGQRGQRLFDGITGLRRKPPLVVAAARPLSRNSGTRGRPRNDCK
jgi:hypothetical protein